MSIRERHIRMTRKPLAELLQERVVVFDGAMGTELYNRHQFINVCFEDLCRTRPDLVKEIHQSNRDAGADVLTTNSFGANRFKLANHLLGKQVREINMAAARVAREVAGKDMLVAGSVGPLGKPVGKGGIPTAEAIEAFGEAIEALKDGGVDFILFETFDRREDLCAAIRAISEFDIPYLPCMVLTESGMDRHGETAETFFAPLPEDVPKPVAIGFNCGIGPKEMLEQISDYIQTAPYPVLVMPNAGYPQRVNDRFIYMTSPEYLNTYAMHFVQVGARCIGGCCGTNAEHIHALAQGVKSVHRARQLHSIETGSAAALVQPTATKDRSRLANTKDRGQWVTTIELVPPLGYDLQPTVEKAALAYRNGVDAINIPDGPRASSRVSPLITAAAIQNEAGIEVLLHLTCRDRNVIGMQSDLLGCAAAGINNVLIITGDPPKLGDYPFSSAVFDLDSIGLTRIADRLNRGVDIAGKTIDPPTKFHIGVGVDPTHLDMEREIDRFFQKVEAGADFAITQPVYEPEVLLRFIERVKSAKIPIVMGLWPLASYQNALFMNNEVPGVTIPDHVMKRMSAAADDREAAREHGIAIARELLDAVRHAFAGVQVSAPLGRIDIALDVLEP